MPQRTDYAAARVQRYRRLAASLPYSLGERLSLRAIPDVYDLPLKAQATLSAALDLGLAMKKNKVVKAVRELQQDPLQDAFTLLEKVGITPCMSPDVLRLLTAPVPSERAVNLEAVLDLHCSQGRHQDADERLPERAYTLLRELMQVCFPGMTGIAADAYARTERMKPLARLVLAAEKVLDGDDIQDAEIVLLAGWVQELSTQVKGIIDGNESYQRAIEESGVLWED